MTPDLEPGERGQQVRMSFAAVTQEFEKLVKYRLTWDWAYGGLLGNWYQGGVGPVEVEVGLVLTSDTDWALTCVAVEEAVKMRVLP